MGRWGAFLGCSRAMMGRGFARFNFVGVMSYCLGELFFSGGAFASRLSGCGELGGDF